MNGNVPIIRLGTSATARRPWPDKPGRRNERSAPTNQRRLDDRWPPSRFSANSSPCSSQALKKLGSWSFDLAASFVSSAARTKMEKSPGWDAFAAFRPEPFRDHLAELELALILECTGASLTDERRDSRRVDSPRSVQPDPRRSSQSDDRHVPIRVHSRILRAVGGGAARACRASHRFKYLYNVRTPSRGRIW